MSRYPDAPPVSPLDAQRGCAPEFALVYATLKAMPIRDLKTLARGKVPYYGTMTQEKLAQAIATWAGERQALWRAGWEAGRQSKASDQWNSLVTDAQEARRQGYNAGRAEGGATATAAIHQARKEGYESAAAGHEARLDAVSQHNTTLVAQNDALSRRLTAATAQVTTQARRMRALIVGLFVFSMLAYTLGYVLGAC